MNTSTTRRLCALVAIAGLGAGSEAFATAAKVKKPKPSCRLVVGHTGTATGSVFGVPMSNDPNLNILSADIATDAKRVTAVFRMAAMPANGSTMDQGSPGGREFQFTFSYLAPPAAGSTTPVQKSVTLTATQSPLGNKFQEGAGTGAFYPTTKQIHITVPFSALQISLKKGTVLSGLRAQSGRIVDTPGPLVALGPADLATSSKTYRAGYPSCIKVGA